MSIPKGVPLDAPTVRLFSCSMARVDFDGMDFLCWEIAARLRMNSLLAQSRNMPVRRGFSMPYPTSGSMSNAMIILSSSVRRVPISG